MSVTTSKCSYDFVEYGVGTPLAVSPTPFIESVIAKLPTLFSFLLRTSYAD